MANDYRIPYRIPSVPSTVPRPQTQVASSTFGPDPSKPASWVIREKGTGKVIMETFDQNIVQRLNTQRYEAVPIQIYLGSLNARG